MITPSSTKETGITIIEVLLVVVIGSALFLISLAALRTLRQHADIDSAIHQLIATVQLAHNKTLASQNESNYGIHFENGQYILFKGSTYNASASDNEVHDLPSQLELYNIGVGGGSDVVFDRVYGTTSDAGTVSMRVIAEPANSRTISILTSGQVGFQGSVNPIDSRITDTRHLHFNLGWSIKNATTLTLEFSDPPNPNVKVGVVMADYFNPTKTDFEWEGTVDVNGSDQTLRINTHSLDSTDTLLSIHRDRRFNNKAVAILIDDHELVSYAVDGTATVGSFGGTMEQQ